MASEKVETVVAGNYVEMEREEGDSKSAKSKLSNLFWHGGSVYDAWFSCASNQAHFLHFVANFFLLTHFVNHFELIFFYVAYEIAYRLLKCYLHCHIHSHNWECYLGFCSNFFTA